MKTGNLEGFVDRTWQVVHDSSELAAAVTSYTISGLDGDTDVKYRLISRVVNGYNGGSLGLLRINNDSGANYGNQYLYGQNTGLTALRNTNYTSIIISNTTAINYLHFSDVLINAKTGNVRTCILKDAQSINGTTVDGVSIQGFSWNNTIDNITSLVLLSNQTNGIGIGSRFILLKEVHVPSGLRAGELDIRGTLKGAWQEVYRHTVTGSAETSITVSGLLGNTLDQILRIRIRYVNGYNGANSYYIRLNETDTPYGYQSLKGASTTASSARNTESRLNPLSQVTALGQIVHEETLLYAKSGFVRTALVETAAGISTTTVTDVSLLGASWNDASTQIISIGFISNQANGLGIGTEIVIERLNL